MSVKSKPKNKKSAPPKKNTKRKPATPPRKDSRPTKSTPPRIQREVLSIALLTISIFIFFSLLSTNKSGIFGGFLKSLLLGIFGGGSILLAIASFCASIYIYFSKSGKFYKGQVILFCIIFCNILAFLHMLSFDASLDTSTNYISVNYANGSLTNGGLIGAFLGDLLKKLLGTAGTYLIIVSSLTISTILFTGRSLYPLIEKLTAYIKEMQENRQEYYEEDDYSDDTSEEELTTYSYSDSTQNKNISLNVNNSDIANRKETIKVPKRPIFFKADNPPPKNSNSTEPSENYTLLKEYEAKYAESERKIAYLEDDNFRLKSALTNKDDLIQKLQGEIEDLNRLINLSTEIPETSSPTVESDTEIISNIEKSDIYKMLPFEIGEDDEAFDNDNIISQSNPIEGDILDFTEDNTTLFEEPIDDIENFIIDAIVDAEPLDSPVLHESYNTYEEQEDKSVGHKEPEELFEKQRYAVDPQALIQEKLNKEPMQQEKATTPPQEERTIRQAVPYVYRKPSLEFLNPKPQSANTNHRLEILENTKKLEETLLSFGVSAKVIEVNKGPSVTRYEVQPGPGVKVSKIANLSDDLALNLAAKGIRIQAPIPGKAAVGIEVPNKDVENVYLREILDSDEFKKFPSNLAFGIGKDIAGKVVVFDIGKMPHTLIAGATGSGKSVCINTLITSIIYKSSPEHVKLLMIDPKVVELSIYNGIPHLLIPVVTDPKKAASALYWAVKEMEKRYKLFADNSVRDLNGFNNILKERGEDIEPQIVIIIDELADLMMTAAKDVEDAICRLAQMARAAGIHLIIATQRPSVDVITGIIKANIPSRMAFAVSSGIDSRTILDVTGAEKLLGKGDMLFSPYGSSEPLRVQGAFISDKEVENIVNFLKKDVAQEYDDAIINEITSVTKKSSSDKDESQDDLYNEVVDFIVEKQKASASLIQRQFRIGYNRAARLIESLEDAGIVGPEDGSKPRKVELTKLQWEEMQGQDD